MKKLTLFFATLLSISVLFTACPPQPPVEESTAMNYWDGMFYSYNEDNDHPWGEYSYIFMTNTLDANDQGQFSGEGKCIFLQVIAPTAKSNQIPAGTYPVVDYQGTEVPTQDMVLAGYQYDALADYGYPGVYLVDMGTYAWNITATDTTTLYVIGGDLTVAYEGNVAKLTLKAKFDNGTSETFAFEGAMNVGDYEWPVPEDPYEYESTEAVQHNLAFTSCDMSYEADYGCWVLSAEKDNYKLGATFYSENTEDASGSYTVSDSQDNGTVQASPGASDGNIYYSFWGTTTEDGYIQDVWFITSGSMTVTGANFTCNFTSHFGSTLQGSYTAAEAAPEMAKAPRNIKPIAKKANVKNSLIQRPTCLK